MARDLIPPPSPAGRPEPEGSRPPREELRSAPPPGGVGDELFLAVRPDDGDEPEAERDDPPARAASPYRARFGFITGALIGIAMAAVAVVVLLASGHATTSADHWSAWAPSAGDDVSRLRQIALHVGREYRLDDGSQLVDVDAGPIAINGVPLQVVVKTSALGGDLLPIDGTGAFFVLTGFGPNGSIEGGKPSTERLALVKREALELALYTFHYVKDVDHVVLVLPPPPPAATATASPSATPSATPAATPTTTTLDGSGLPSADVSLNALLFRPGDLGSMLKAPLTSTIPALPPRPSTITERDAQAITAFTAPNVFDASVRSISTGDAFLLLERPQNPTLRQLLQPTIKKSGG